MEQKSEEVMLQISKVFTPFVPISKIELLKGRKKEISRFKEILNLPGRQAILYGDRALGKSSIARIVKNIAEEQDYVVTIVFCFRNDTYSLISKRILEEAEVDSAPHTDTSSKETTIGSSIGAKGGIKFIAEASGELDGKVIMGSSQSAQYQPNYDDPSWVAKALAKEPTGKRRLIILEEYDRVEDDDTHDKIAEMVKLLSDEQSYGCKLLIVGVAKTSNELLGAHGSLPGRALTKVKVKRVDDTAIGTIFLDGMAKLGCEIARPMPILGKSSHNEETLLETVVGKCSGYPLYAHLIGQECAKIALGTDGGKRITFPVLRKALESCVELDEEEIVDQFNDIIESSRGKKSKSQKMLVMFAASRCNQDKFTIEDVAKQVEKLLKHDFYSNRFKGLAISQQLSHSIFRSLMKTTKNHKALFCHIKRTYYAFDDPRMACYVSMIIDQPLAKWQELLQ